MNFTTSLAVLALAMFMAATSVEAYDTDTVLCRKNEGGSGISQCVDDPIKKDKLSEELKDDLGKKKKWCPYRMCGGSYKAADRCGPNGATARCMVSHDEKGKKIYMCRKNKATKTIGYPLGCTGYECTGTIDICRCKKSAVERTLYTFYDTKNLPQCY